LAETEAVKDKFKTDADIINDLKNQGQLDGKVATDQLKKLSVDEANIIRDLLLNFDKAHKEEEAALRAKFDKQHIDE